MKWVSHIHDFNKSQIRFHIPMDALEKLDWLENTELVAEQRENEVVIYKDPKVLRARLTIQALYNAITLPRSVKDGCISEIHLEVRRGRLVVKLFPNLFK